MRLLILLITSSVLFIQNAKGQTSKIVQPQSVIVLDDEIISENILNNLNPSRIKSMTKGVSQQVRDSLAEIYGKQIKDREFIVIVKTKNSKITTMGDSEIQPKSKTQPRKEDNLILHEGDQAADFTVKMINGQEVKLSDLKGSVVLLNFWATWCAPCLKEFHEIPSAILDKYRDEKVVFLPISRGESKDMVQSKLNWLKERGVSFDSGYDPEEKIWDKYALKSIPTNFIIDQEGIIRYTSQGYSESSVTKIAEQIQELLD